MLVGATLSPSSAADAAAGDTSLYLVTLEGAGQAGYHGPLPSWVHRSVLLETQDEVLDEIGVEAPLYQWTSALNGFAAELTPGQAETLRGDERVVLVEKNAVRPLAGAPGAGAGLGRTHPRHGGAGQVIGMVDTGIWPRELAVRPGPRARSSPARLPRRVRRRRCLGARRLQRQGDRRPVVRRRIRTGRRAQLVVAVAAR